MAIKLMTFKGMAPRISPRALPNEMAQLAVNCRLLSGDLEAWNDIADIHALGKAGPTNTAYLMGGYAWLNWAQSEVASGFTNIDVARVPIAGDTTELTIFTGTGTPQITTLQQATGGSTNPYGAYPLASSQLAVNPPADPPTVVNTPGVGQGNTTNQKYVGDFTPWTSGIDGGAYGGFNPTASGTGNSALPAPVYAGFYQSPNRVFSESPAIFSFGTCTNFTFSILISPDVTNTDQAPNGYITVLAGGQTGAELNLNFRDGNAVTWQDIVGGGSLTTLASGAVDQHHGYRVDITGTNNGLDITTGLRTFTIGVKVTRLSDSAVVCSATGLTATYGGENMVIGGYGGTGPDVQNIYFGNANFTVLQPPASFIPVFSNYVFTYANSLGFDSAPSPNSTPVIQVDNGSLNIITIPPPPGGQDVKEIFLWRAATGSSGTEYLEWVNPGTAEGGIQIASASGSANALVLTTQAADGAPAGSATFFKAINTSTAAVTAAIDADGALAVVDGNTGVAVGAGGVSAGSYYTLYKGMISYATQVTAASQAVVILASTKGIFVGDTVTDSQGVIPTGTTVIDVSATSVTLSANLSAQMAAGDALTFGNNNLRLFSDYTVIDTVPTADLGTALESANFDPPPADLQGIIALPNQIMAGFVGNTLYLSAQGHPQAWPQEFALPTDSPIVAIAAIDTTVVVLTQAQPYTAYGATPDSFVMTKEEIIQGCTSKRGVVYQRGLGVLYPSTDGYYAYGGQGQIRRITEQLFTLREWLPLNPQSIIAAVHQSIVFFWYDNGTTKSGYMLDADPSGFGLVEVDFHAIAAAINTTDDSLFMVMNQGQIAGGVTPANNELVQWDAAVTKRPYTWKSKLYRQGHAPVFQMARIRAGSYTDTVLKLIGDNGVQFASLTPYSVEEFLIPAQRVQSIVVELSGTDSVEDLEMVESIAELSQ